jgi:hypothetical protein
MMTVTLSGPPKCRMQQSLDAKYNNNNNNNNNNNQFFAKSQNRLSSIGEGLCADQHVILPIGPDAVPDMAVEVVEASANTVNEKIE